MRTIKLIGLDEKMYYDKCLNGLQIYVWKNAKINTFKGALVYKGGAENTDFYINKEKKSVPKGTPHFLEHIMCKNNDGSSLLGKFNELNSYSNAATYPDKTIYEFVGTTDIYQNISLLLKSIENKRFIKKYFEAERGPILEEARMREDDSSRVFYYSLNNSLFHTYPNRVSGLGSKEDIKNIKIEDLKLFYNTYYHPENSILIITGNVEPSKVIKFVKEKQNIIAKNDFVKPKPEKYKEPLEVVTKFKEIYGNIEVPKITVAVKIPIKSLPKKNIVTILNIFQLVLISNFGSTSLLKEELLEKKLIINIGSSAEWEKDFIILKVSAKTKKPLEVKKILEEKIQNLEIRKEDIFRKIKSEIANLVLGFEDPEYVNDYLAYMLVKYGKIIEDEKPILENITLKDVKEVMNLAKPLNYTTLIMYPLKKSDN